MLIFVDIIKTRILKLKGKILLKYTLVSLASLLVLLTLLIFSLRLPAVQNYLKGHLVTYLEDKIKTKVSLDRVFIGFPNSLEIENLYLQGQKVDTLLAAEKFRVDLDMWQLLNSKADITAIDAEGISANVVRNADGSFNFDYIIDAFASNEKEKESKPFVLSLDKIDLKKIRVSFIDEQSKNNIALRFNRFNTRVKTFDLDKNAYAIGDLKMDGLKLKLHQDFLEEISENVEETVDSLRQKSPLKLGLESIKLTNFDIDYGDENSKTFAKILFQELNTKVKHLDIENSQFDVNHLKLIGADIRAKLHLAGTKTKPQASQSEPQQPMSLLLGQLVLDNVKVAYDNTAAKPTHQGIDFNHLNFSQLNTEIRNFKMVNGTLEGKVNSAEIREKSGLNIQKFHTDFVYQEKQAYLKRLHLQTPYTTLRDELVLNYNTIEQLSSNPGAVKISANIRQSKIGFRDILLFAPDLRKTSPFSQYPNAILHLNTRLRGTINDLEIATLQMSGLGDIKASLSGKIKNATQPERLFYDIKLQNFGASAKTILNITPKGSIPSNISLPSHFAISGTAKGTTQVIDTRLKMISSLGNADVDAFLDLRQKNNEKYDVNANLAQLQIGKIIQNKDLGMVTGHLVAQGQGFDFAKGNASVKGHLAAFDYNQYRYRNVNLNAKLNRGAYQVHLNSKDPNAQLNLLASGVYNEHQPTVNLSGSIIKLDVHKLGFYAEPLILAGNIDGAFTNLNPDFLNGYLQLDNFAISDTKEVVPIQNIRLQASSNEQENTFSLQSQIADLEMKGQYRLTQIFGALQSTLNQYYQFQKPSVLPKIQAGQYFTLDARVKDDDLIRKFVPDLKSFETITLHGNYDADSRSISLEALIPSVQYAENTIENATFKLSNNADALLYDLNVGKINTSQIALNQVAATGTIAENTITYHISTKDDKGVEQFLIAGSLQSADEVMQISLNPDGLKLNYDTWAVAPENQIKFRNGGIWANQFILSNEGSQIAIQSEHQRMNAPLNVEISNFQIETLTEMVKKDTLLAKGTINGNVKLLDFKNLNFNSDLNISELQIFNNPIGDISAKVNTKSAQVLDTNIALTGYDNDVRITGDYNIAQSAFDLKLALNRFQMKSLQGFTMGNITNAEGYISGAIDIQGTPSKPSILGKIQFNNVGMEIAKTGSDFRNINDDILFVSDGIRFNQFKLNDTDGNALIFDGNIFTPNYQDFDFDMTLKARDFKAVNSKEDNDKMMYGVLAINADLNIKGDLDLPKVDGRLAVTDQTDFTFVVPQSSPTKQDRDGIVEFVDQDQIVLNKTLKADSIDSQSDIRGMDVNVNISIIKEAKLSLIIDKASGDFVKLQGEADLTGGIDPSGKTSLVGVYQVEKGAYEMSFSMIKRKFEVQKGSTITWTGEPMLAQLDMTAIYTTNAAPIDLLQNQITSDELNYYKQRIPFNTLLILKGELMKPQLSFDITTAENNNAVSQEVLATTIAKLEQLRVDENEMNKQVFALLILNRFIGENPFQSESGLSAGTMAKQSVSQILSQQLNNIASDLIAGVDITFDFDSYEDYSTGSRNERTDLNVNLSKRLLDDRLKISVGSNFGLEGEARQGEQMTNIAGNITADYMLSKDGRYTLRAYRKNDYQVALQGQIIETGVGFIITLDYDEFRSIFRRVRKNRDANKHLRTIRKEVEFVK